MKNRLYLSILAAAVACAVPSCTETPEDYVPAESETGNAFYFASNSATSFTMTEGGSITVPINRVNASEAATVTFTVVADKDVFTVPESASFDAGSQVANINIAYDFNKAVVGQPYTLSFKINSESSQYGLDTLAITATSPSQWVDFLNPVTKKPALVTFSTNWVGEDILAYIHYVEDENGVRSCQTYNESFVSGSDTYKNTYFGLEDNDHLTFKWYTKEKNSSGYQMIEVPVHVIGTNSNYGEIEACDYFHYYYTINGITKYGSTYLEFAPNAESMGLKLPYYDGNGGFYINLAYPINTSGRWYGEYEDVGIAEGFERTIDYNTLSYSEKWIADVESEFFGDSWSDQKVSIGDDDSTLVYLPQYFTDTTGLAFRVNEEGQVEDVDNEQYTGVDTWGDKIYVTVKKGEVLSVSDEGYPSYAVTLSVYSKRYNEEDSTWTKNTDYGSVTDTISVTADAWYSADALTGLKKATYTGYSWVMEATDFSSGDREQIGLIYFEDAGTDEDGNEWLTMKGASGWGSNYWAKGDSLSVMWYGGYLYLPAQTIEDSFTYNGEAYDIGVYLLNSKGQSYTDKGYLLGGYSTDDKLVAFTNYPSNEGKVDGLYWLSDIGYISAFYEIALYAYENLNPEGSSLEVGKRPVLSLDGRKPDLHKEGLKAATSRVKAANKVFSLEPATNVPAKERPAERLQTKTLR